MGLECRDPRWWWWGGGGILVVVVVALPKRCKAVRNSVMRATNQHELSALLAIYWQLGARQGRGCRDACGGCGHHAHVISGEKQDACECIRCGQ